MQSLHQNLLKIIKTALSDIPIEIKDTFDYKELLKLSIKHHITPLVFNGLYKIYGDIKELQEFRQHTYKMVYHDQNQLYFIDLIEKSFKDNGIDYMLLKGASIKKYYPSSELRLMSDIDVLIKTEQYEKIREALLQIGLTEVAESNHELIWKSDSGVNIELHKHLIPTYNDDYYAYYTDPWKKFAKGEGNRFQMSPEDEYIYIFTHMTKHYRDGGIGLRHIIDIYFFALKNPDLDMQYIENELEKPELNEFHKNILNMIDVWFNGKQATVLSDYMTERIIKSGAYGLIDARDYANAARKSAMAASVSVAKKRAILHSMFLPLSELKKKYPILRKMPFLLPVMWVVRWIDAILNKRDNIARQAERIGRIDTDIVDRYNKELEIVGLKFRLKKF